MTTKNYFARNADGSLKRKQPCPTPGCNYPNEHLCLVGKADTFGKILLQEANGKRRWAPRPKGFVMDDDHREKIRAALQAKFDEKNARNRQRDLIIVETYNRGGVKKAALARQFHMSVEVLNRILVRSDALLAGRY